MLPEWVSQLPGWLLTGLGLGVVLSVIVAAAFVIGTRVFPNTRGPSDPSDGGEARRRAEIRDYLRRIDEPFLEDHEIASRTVAFFLPDRDVAITFDAHDYFLLERTGVHAVLLEYEVPGATLGGRLPFETPDEPTAGKAGRRPGMTPIEDRMETAFSELGLPPSASEDELRRAYRDRIKDAHPDHGGDPETFRRVREAYTVARKRSE